MSSTEPKTELLVPEAHEIQGFEPTNENVELLKTTLMSGGTTLTDPELKLFLYQVKRTALDPLARQIYVMKDRSGKISFITSIDGYRLVAERSGKYLGQTKTEWQFNAEGNVLSATVGVIKKVGNDKDITYATAWFDEYAKDLDKYYSMWKKMPKTMIAKVAESLALRKAFPQELGGVYTEDEMQQAQETTKDDNITRVYQHTDFQPEPTRDVNEDIASESITPGMITKLGGQVKLKGITDRASIMNILNNLAKTKGGETIKDISLLQANELYTRIKDTDVETLKMLMETE
jgi:phage recombination protein Bet